MKKLITSLTVVATALLLVACGKDSTSKNNQNNANCGMNYYWNGSQCIYSQGYNPDLNLGLTRTAFADGSSTFQMAGRHFNGALRITDQTGYRAFLKEALGVCDRNIWGWSSGLAECSTWAAGQLYVSFNVGSDLVPSLTFTAYPPVSYTNYYINIGINAGGAAYNPLILASGNTYSLINDSKGFEIRANGALGTASSRYLIQLIVREGTLQNGEVRYDLAYKNGTSNRVFASGIMKKVH